MINRISAPRQRGLISEGQLSFMLSAACGAGVFTSLQVLLSVRPVLLLVGVHAMVIMPWWSASSMLHRRGTKMVTRGCLSRLHTDHRRNCRPSMQLGNSALSSASHHIAWPTRQENRPLKAARFISPEPMLPACTNHQTRLQIFSRVTSQIADKFPLAAPDTDMIDCIASLIEWLARQKDKKGKI